jgi:membrane-bound lytic murein transglycosylase D
VNVGTQINLNLAAKLAGLSTHDFNRLNPGYRLGVTDPDGPHLLTLPIDKIDNFKQQLTAIPVEMLLTGVSAKPSVDVTESEDVAVAETTVGMLTVARAERIERSTKKYTATALTSRITTPLPVNLLESKKKITTHIVKMGDTLWTIAHDYKVSVEELTRLNGLQRKGKGLQFGKKLTIPGGDS